MTHCLFVSDLHGRARRYEALFSAIQEIRPQAVFLGGDLLPFPTAPADAPPGDDFVRDYFAVRLAALGQELGDHFPRIFLIPGNDDPRAACDVFLELEHLGFWQWAHARVLPFGSYAVLGYAFVPPTPFLLKDWERYDVGQHTPPGSVSPEEGFQSVPIPEQERRYATIAEDLDRIALGIDVRNTILLAHSPPYQSALDRAALDGKAVDYAPLDVHVGSVAVRRFIEARQPHLGLHGHIHESARLTGSWRDCIGRTPCLSAAHDGPELALVRFDLEHPETATRELR